jgi:hypothetical protein
MTFIEHSHQQTNKSHILRLATVVRIVRVVTGARVISSSVSICGGDYGNQNDNPDSVRHGTHDGQDAENTRGLVVALLNEGPPSAPNRTAEPTSNENDQGYDGMCLMAGLINHYHLHRSGPCRLHVDGLPRLRVSMRVALRWVPLLRWVLRISASTLGGVGLGVGLVSLGWVGRGSPCMLRGVGLGVRGLCLGVSLGGVRVGVLCSCVRLLHLIVGPVTFGCRLLGLAVRCKRGRGLRRRGTGIRAVRGVVDRHSDTYK